MKRVEAFDRLAADHGVTPSGLAPAWPVNHPLVAAPVIGVSKESQWQGVHEALRLEWTAELSARLDELFPANCPPELPVRRGKPLDVAVLSTAWTCSRSRLKPVVRSRRSG
jgi:diketogulonate reductase-like aldo/keto reductase